MGFFRGPNIVREGLVLALDAASPRSYPGSGTVWNDLAGSNNGTLTGGPTFNSGNGGSTSKPAECAPRQTRGLAHIYAARRRRLLAVYNAG